MDDSNEQKERKEPISTNYIGRFVLDNNRFYFDCNPNKSEKVSVICMTKCPKCDNMHENITWCYSDKEKKKILDRSCFKKLMKQIDAINKAQNRSKSERQTTVVKDSKKPGDNMKIVEPPDVIDTFSYYSDQGSFSLETESESSSILLEEWDRTDGSPLTVTSEDYADLDEVSHVRIFGSLRDCGKIHSDCKSEEDLTVNQRKFSLVRSVKSFTSASDLGIEPITIEQKVKEKRDQEKMLFRHRASIDVHKLKETDMIILSDVSDDEHKRITRKHKKSRGNNVAVQQINILCQEIEELEKKLQQKRMELQKFRRLSNS